MSGKVAELTARREALIARSHAHRAALAAATAELRASLGFAERVFGFARKVRAHPVLAGALVAALLLVKPVRTLRWVSNGLAIYAAIRQARGLFRG